MRKVLLFNGLKYQDLILTLIYGVIRVSMRMSVETFISIPIFYFVLTAWLNRRYVQMNRRVLFLLIHLVWVFFSGFEIKIEFILLILFILWITIFYQYHSKEYLDMLVWMDSFPLIVEGYLMRDRLVINQQVYPKNLLFPLTQEEFNVMPKHLKAMDSKLLIEEVKILDERYKAYQIHH
jgi:hypothetical protein